MRGLVHSIRVYLRDPRIKTSWAACLDNQGTLESTRGSVFLRVSVLSRTLRLAMWPGTRTLIYLDLVGTQGVSEGEPQADQRGDVEPDNVGCFLSSPHIHVLPGPSTRTLLTRNVGTYRQWLLDNIPWRKLDQAPPNPQLGSNLNLVSFPASPPPPCGNCVADVLAQNIIRQATFEL